MDNSARYSDYRDTVAFRAGTRLKQMGFSIANSLGIEIEEERRPHLSQNFWLLYNDTGAPQRRRWFRTRKQRRPRVALISFDGRNVTEGHWHVAVYGEQYLGVVQYSVTEVAMAEDPEIKVTVSLENTLPRYEDDVMTYIYG